MNALKNIAIFSSCVDSSFSSATPLMLSLADDAKQPKCLLSSTVQDYRGKIVEVALTTGSLAVGKGIRQGWAV